MSSCVHNGVVAQPWAFNVIAYSDHYRSAGHFLITIF
jgi:hypothetical protein